ncbi:unnamed protein product, partial [Rotaria socialis]
PRLLNSNSRSSEQTRQYSYHWSTFVVVEQSIDNPIALRTRSQTHTESTDSNVIDLVQQRDNMEQLTTNIDSLSLIYNTDKDHQQSHDVENKCLIHSPIQETIGNIKTDDGSSP